MAAYGAMQDWVRQQAGPGTSLSMEDWIAGAPENSLKGAIRELENHLFSAASINGNQHQWDGNSLQKCLPDLLRLAARSKGGPDPVITDLYPATSGR